MLSIVSILLAVLISVAYAEYTNQIKINSGTYTVKSSLPEYISKWQGTLQPFVVEENAIIVRWQAENPVNSDETVIAASLLDTTSKLSYFICIVHFYKNTTEVFADEQMVKLGVPSFKLTVIKEPVPVEVLTVIARNWKPIKKI